MMFDNICKGLFCFFSLYLVWHIFQYAEFQKQRAEDIRTGKLILVNYER